MSKLNFAGAVTDITIALRKHELWRFMAWLQIKQRYRRSVIGPFWITITTAIYIAALGLIFGVLFQKRSVDLLPWITLGVISWNLISIYINECSLAFIERRGFILQGAPSYILFVFECLTKNVWISAHSLIIYVGVCFIFRVVPTFDTLWIFITFPLFFIILVPIGLIFAILSTRLRDLPPLVTSILTIGFFLTPVMWMPEQLHSHRYVADFNPFARLVSLIREPLLGIAPSFGTLLVGVVGAVVAWAIAFLLLARFRDRIAFWL